MTKDLTRRRLLTAAGAAGLGTVLTACSKGSASGETATSGGAWSFTDDRKKQATAKSRPTRIVAFTGTAAALWDFGVRSQIVGVFGPTKLKNGKADPQAGSLDVNGVTILGNVWGEFNLEKYAKLRPDLLVTNMYIPNSLWYVPDASEKKILALAPCVALATAKVPLRTPIERHAELAKSLGADLSAKPVVEAKARFDKAAEDLRKVAASKKGLRVLAASAQTNLFYVSDPRYYTDLSFFTELGVEFVLPEKTDKGGFYQGLSWETADKYQADLILLDGRTGSLQPKDLTNRPAWSALPAVKAGQIMNWMSEPRFSYAGATPLIEAITKAVNAAKPVTS